MLDVVREIKGTTFFAAFNDDDVAGVGDTLLLQLLDGCHLVKMFRMNSSPKKAIWK